jgi:dihydroorotase/N-acyl-D-amino-acid deacylase
MSTTPPPDVLIIGARVVDGTGNPWFYGDVALAGDRIAEVAPPSGGDRAAAREVVSADGLVVCPGFIDIQSHSIIPFLSDRRSLSKVTQGVTTEIMGESWTPSPFGGRIALPFPEERRGRIGETFDEWNERARGWTRFGDWLADLESRGVSVNVGSFVGGGTIREFGKGFALGEATPSELAAMRAALEGAMRDGAFGLATALIYPPGAYAGTEELVALCEVVAAHRGVHITHVRSEEARLLEGIDEAIAIAARTGVATEIYRLKAAGRPNWEKMPAAIARIDAARAAGLDVTADMYPYEAAGTGLASCLPPWAEADDKLYENLADPAARARIREEMLRPTGDWENLGASAGPENVVLAGLLLPEHAGYLNRGLAEVAAERGQDWADAAIDLLAAEGQNVFCFYRMMGEENLRLQMRQPWIAFATDAGGVDPAGLAGGGLLHPRAFGTYPRVLGRYVREQGVLTVEDAVRKMSSAVASRLGLRDRGLLRAGMAADVVLFDPATIVDRATFEEPHRLSAGVRDVWVNGERVLRDGAHSGAMPGRRLDGPGREAARHR